jgi:hypothetical protein
MKRFTAVLVIAALIVGLATVPTPADQTNVSSSPLSSSSSSDASDRPDPPGELQILDAIIIRPFAIAACVVGLAGALVVWPFAATSGSQDRVGRELLVKPFDFAFKRPLGDINW